ncbi:MAG: LPP20 family lipoprotein [Proteobacteria bacterium]|nr:LPP20 family lipoprotein [Pseudomonadota bacterium]
MTCKKTKKIFVTFTLCSLFLSSGCLQNFENSSFLNSSKSPLQNKSSESDGILALKEVFNSSVEKIPTLSAVGYAVVSSQPGRTNAQKRLMAIRSARMAAMRELAEQIHGIQLDSNTTVIDLMVQNDTFRAVVKGLIRGAKTVRINPTGEDTYETVLEIDRDMMVMMLRNARRT